VCSGPGRI